MSGVHSGAESNYESSTHHSCALWAGAFPKRVLQNRHPKYRVGEVLSRKDRADGGLRVVIVGRLWFLCSHCLGFYEANVK